MKNNSRWDKLLNRVWKTILGEHISKCHKHDLCKFYDKHSVTCNNENGIGCGKL